MEKSSDIENSIESLRSILPGSVIDIIEDYYMEYFKSASETLDNMAGETEIEDKEEDEDEEDDDDLGIETEIWIFPGFLGFKLGIKPEFALSVGGNLNIEALNRHLLKMAVNAHAAGEIGLVLSVGAILGNALLSLEGELDAGGKITGGSDGGKFLEISGFTIEVVKSDGQTKLKHGEAQLSAQVKAEVSLGGSLSAGSKIVGWKKELVSGEVKTTVASFNMTGKVIKKGPLLSLSGWQLSNTTVATSILNEAKAKAIDVAFADEKNIEGIADLTQSIEDRSEQIALLDKTLATIENEIKSASAFAFSKENGAYNKAIVHDLEKLWEAYYAQIKLSEDDMKKIDVQIEENSKDPKTVKGIQEVQKCIQKRIDRKALLDKWKKDNTNDKGMLKRTRKEVLAFYSIISDNGSGYARDDAEYRQDQAEADLFSKDEMMNYEKKRIEEKKKGRRELYDEVADAAYFANSDEEFLEEYIKIRGKNKGFINHLLKHGVSLGIFSQEELRARLLTYEQTRIGELTGATPFDTLLKNAELIKNKDEVNVSVNSRIFKTDEKLWTEYVMDVSTPEDILDYENTRSRELNTSGLIEKTVDPLWRALTEIRGLKKLYDNEKDEKTKWQYKHDAEHKAIDALKKAGFVSKGYFSYDKSKEEYKSLSSEDLKEIISDYADIDYYSENVSKQKSEIAALKSTDAKKVKAALEKSGNRKIYDQYIDHLLKEKEYSESIFSLDDIVEYEKEKQDHYEKNNDKKSADKHAERVQFLMYEQDQIKYLNAANLTGGKEAGQKETQAAMTLYFTGVRPVGHKEMNAEIGKEEDKAQWNVGMAKGYIERLKKKPPTKEVMIEALKWAASTDEAYENYSKAKISVDNKGSESAPAVFEEWKDKVGGDAEKALGSAIDKKKTDRTYDSWSKIDNWIAFIEYQLKGPEHFDRIDTIEKMISDGKSPDEIKKAYREKLGGGARFAEVLVKQPTGKLTVNRFLEFYRKTGQELKYAESGKHAERLKIIKETADFDEMVRLYNGSENAARFEQELLNDETVRKKLTREMILDYERKKADIGSTRHQARLAALDSAKDNAEAARLYKEDFNAGNGFEGANRDKAKNRAVKIATSRTGDAELQRIYEYEEKKRKFWEDAKKKYLKPVDDLKAKHEELENLVKDAAEKINKIVGDISALEEEGASVGNVKKAVTTARTSVSAANRNKGMIPELTEAHDKIDGYIAEQKKIREEIIEKNEQLIREEQEAEKKGVLTS